MLQRLVGLETEYALRFHPRAANGPTVSNGTLFSRLIDHVRTKVPVVSAIIKEFGWFTGNGGAVRFERNPLFILLPSAGLVEGATPECRGPSQLLQYQRAQDVLLSRAAAASGPPEGEATLIKNNRDSKGSVYGSHENYEATIASGAALVAWRVGVALLMPFFLPVTVAVGLLFLISLLLQAPVLLVRASLSRRFDLPRPWEYVVEWLSTLMLLPVLAVSDLLVRVTAFRRVRRALLPFLVSRPVIAGAGVLSARGRFTLSPRAPYITSVCSVAAEYSRPIFYFGHLWKGILGLLMGDVAGFAKLFHRRQRLQMGVGDSNMAQFAEYLKIGTTLLVIDAAEAGELADVPRVYWPRRALRRIASDPELRATVRLSGGRRWTGLQIQRYYFDACRRYASRQEPISPEAEKILALWDEALTALEDEPSRMIGKLDWVTKRYLLETAGRDVPLDARRKIDLRYHELSREGYYTQMEAIGLAPTLVEPEQVLTATTTPPADTPAAMRGRLIHDHAARAQDVAASWSSVRIVSNGRVRTIRLSAPDADKPHADKPDADKPDADKPEA
jgi:Pup amidohydrolase